MSTRHATLFLLLICGAPWLMAAEPELRKALAAGDLAHVEAIAQSLERDYASGSLTGDDYIDRISDTLPDNVPENWERYLRQWRASHPKSYIASFSLGLYYDRLARQLRGPKSASETAPEQLASYREYEQKARAELESSLSLSDKPYPSYCTLIRTVAGLKGGEKERYFRAALQVDPYSLNAWHTYLSFIVPRWGGSVEQMKNLVAEAQHSQLRESEKRHLAAIEYTLQAENAADLEHYQEAVYFYQAAYQELPGEKTVWRLVRAGETARKGKLIDLAITLYSKALDVDARNTDALNGRGKVYEFDKADLTMAFADYKRSADLGNAWARDLVGRWYSLGKGTVKDPQKAQAYASTPKCSPPLICP